MSSALQNRGFKRIETPTADPCKLAIPGVDFACDESHPLYDPGRSSVMRDEELIASIDQHGVLENVLVRPNGEYIEVVAGARRVFNARLANIARVDRDEKTHEVPLRWKRLTDKEAIILKSTENSLRKNDQPIDKARRARRMVERFGCSKDEVARAFGVSEGYVRQWFKVLDAPELSGAIDDGRLTFKAAVALATLSPADQTAALGKVAGPPLDVPSAPSVPATARAAKAAAKSVRDSEDTGGPPGLREIRRMIATEEDLETRLVSDAVLNVLRWLAGELPERSIKGLTELRRRSAAR